MSLTITTTRVYDDFTDSDVSKTLWRYLEDSDTDGRGTWRCQEPHARNEIGEGILDIHVDRFQRANDLNQLLDDYKHHLVSVQDFPVSADQPTVVALEIAATNINATAHNHRDGIALLRLIDSEPGWSFHIGTSSDRLIGEYRRISEGGTAQRVAADVVSIASAEVGAPGAVGRRHEVMLDPSRGSLEWRIDGLTAYESSAAMLPKRIRIGLGVGTVHPIAGGRSQSVRGQGISASFGPVEISSDWLEC